MTISGIDVSHWQGTIDWNKVAGAGIRFAILKATDGLSYSKTQWFLDNVPLAREAGLVIGGYHFAQVGVGDPEGQARYYVNLLDQAGWGRGDLPGFLDIETKPDTMTWSQVAEFVNRFAAEFVALTGRPCYAYMTKSWAASISYRPLWLAWWTTTGDPKTVAGTHFWQSTEQGQVNGIVGDVDMDEYLGSEVAFEDLLDYDPVVPTAWDDVVDALDEVKGVIRAEAAMLHTTVTDQHTAQTGHLTQVAGEVKTDLAAIDQHVSDTRVDAEVVAEMVVQGLTLPAVTITWPKE